MLLCALKLKEEGKLKGDTIVGTVMSNIGFHKAAEELREQPFPLLLVTDMYWNICVNTIFRWW